MSKDVLTTMAAGGTDWATNLQGGTGSTTEAHAFVFHVPQRSTAAHSEQETVTVHAFTGEASDSFADTGTVLWPAAPLLCYFLLSDTGRCLVQGASVVSNVLSTFACVHACESVCLRACRMFHAHACKRLQSPSPALCAWSRYDVAGFGTWGWCWYPGFNCRKVSVVMCMHMSCSALEYCMLHNSLC